MPNVVDFQISLNLIPKEEIDNLKFISKTLKESGEECFLVGGSVRDLVLGKVPHEYDLTTSALPETIKSKFKRVFDTGILHGTVTIVIEKSSYEITTYRSEQGFTDGRRPDSVKFGVSLDEDLERRDFTINTLSWDLSQYPKAVLNDPFNGLEDIKRKILRTPLNPEIIFSDDPLRMLRAVRFACTLDFIIEESTFAGIKAMAPRLSIISAERISDEINKILMIPKPSIGFALLLKTGLLQQFFPEMIDLLGAEEVNGIGHKDNFWHTLQVLDNISEVSTNLWLRWAALMHDIAKPPTKRFDEKAGWTFHGHEVLGARWTQRIFRRLSLPLDDRMKYVQKLVRLHLRPIALVDEIVTDSAIRRLLFDAGDDIDDLMNLCRADITSKNQRKVVRFLENFDRVEQKISEVEEKDRIRNWKPPVKGQDIMRALNLMPGPEVGIVKKAIEEAILNGEIPNEYEAAYQFMLSYKTQIDSASQTE